MAWLIAELQCDLATVRTEQLSELINQELFDSLDPAIAIVLALKLGEEGILIQGI